MRFVAKVDDTGAGTVKINDVDLTPNVREFKVHASLGQPTLVNLTLELVEADLDLGNIKENEVHVGTDTAN